LPADEIKARLNAEKTRKTALQADLAKLERLSTVGNVDVAKLKPQIEAHVGDVSSLLNKHTPQARQMLRRRWSDPSSWNPSAAAGSAATSSAVR
jgi:hypothetical protein